MRFRDYTIAALVGATIWILVYGVAYAQGGLQTPVGPIHWLDFTGVGALIGIGVHWGVTKTKMGRLEEDMKTKADTVTLETHMEYIRKGLDRLEKMADRRTEPRE